MNKKIWLLPLLVFLFSCSSVPNVSVPVDYSQEDVLLNEISEITGLTLEQINKLITNEE